MHHLPQLSFLDCLNIARWYVLSPSHGTLGDCVAEAFGIDN
jgi:hypothetical protein